MVCTVKSVYYNLSSLCSTFDNISWLAVSIQASLQKRNGINQHFVLFTGGWGREEGGDLCMYVCACEGGELSDFSRVEITVDRRTV